MVVCRICCQEVQTSGGYYYEHTPGAGRRGVRSAWGSGMMCEASYARHVLPAPEEEVKELANSVITYRQSAKTLHGN